MRRVGHAFSVAWRSTIVTGEDDCHASVFAAYRAVPYIWAGTYRNGGAGSHKKCQWSSGFLAPVVSNQVDLIDIAIHEETCDWNSFICQL